MKKVVLMVMIGLMSIGIIEKPARADNTFTVIKEYGIPCVLSLGLSAALVKNDGAAIGVAICAGLMTATYFNKNMASSDMRATMDTSLDERDMKIQGNIDERFAKMDANQKTANDETRNLFRELLADRLAQMNDELRAEVQKKMAEGDFFPELERKMMTKIKEDVIIEGRARSREVVQECVDQAEKELVANKYVAPTKEDQQEQQK